MGLNYRQDVASAAAHRNGGGSGKQASICFADPGEARGCSTNTVVINLLKRSFTKNYLYSKSKT